MPHAPGPQTELVPFLFEGEHLVRVIRGENGEPNFILADLTKPLGYKSTSEAARLLDDDEKGVHNVHTLGGPQTLTTVSESGLYNLAFRSRKPEGKKLRRWVTQVVLPTIRKTGKFDPTMIAPRAPAPRISSERKSILAGLNAATRALGEVRRSCGVRTAAHAASDIFGKVGVRLDLTRSDILAQEEMDLEPTNVVPFSGKEPA